MACFTMQGGWVAHLRTEWQQFNFSPPACSEFAKEPRFYFPHNVDFRGRAYPMHPHLNHLVRGLPLPAGHPLCCFADAC